MESSALPKKMWNKSNKTEKRKEELTSTLTGFLIFTDKNKEKNCIRDAYIILNDTVEELYPSLQPQQTHVQSTQAMDNFDTELQELKNKKNYFYNFSTNCNGVVFIKIAKEYRDIIIPNDIMLQILSKIKTTKEPISKCISKFIPVNIACKAKYEIFTEKASELILKYFPNDIEGRKSWKCEYRCRNNSSISKSGFMDYILKGMNRDKYYVDYKTPDGTFIIEVTNDLLCGSVVEKYSEYMSYNTQSGAKSDEERMKERERLMKMQKERTKNPNNNNNHNKEESAMELGKSIQETNEPLLGRKTESDKHECINNMCIDIPEKSNQSKIDDNTESEGEIDGI